MKKPRITIYNTPEGYLFYNETVSKSYAGLWPIYTVFKILTIHYVCQKDENGYYLNLPLDKPIFD